MTSTTSPQTHTPSTNAFTHWLGACIALLLISLAPVAMGAVSGSEQRVNPELLELQQKQKPILRKLGERVYATEFIGYSNHGFIEGEDGIIVIDGGWFPTTTQRAISELPAAMREALLLRYAEELRYDEMALVVGAGESTLRSRVHHGLQQLKNKLEDER